MSKRGLITLPKLSRGLSLVELMISLAVGLFIIAGVVHVLNNNKKAFATQNALSRLQEEGRFALEELTRLISMARYDDPANAFAPLSPGIEGSNDPDSITLRFEGGAGINDCLGTPTTVGATVVGTINVDAAGDLACTDAGGTTNKIARGVESLQILYGLDTDADGVPNRYLTAAGVVAAGGNWVNIVTARAGLLMRTPDELAPAADTATYTVLDSVIDPINDRRLRRIFTTTVRIRN